MMHWSNARSVEDLLAHCCEADSASNPVHVAKAAGVRVRFRSLDASLHDGVALCGFDGVDPVIVLDPQAWAVDKSVCKQAVVRCLAQLVTRRNEIRPLSVYGIDTTGIVADGFGR